VLFLDGSVKHAEIRPRPRVGPAVVEPALRKGWENEGPGDEVDGPTPDADGGRAEQAAGGASR